MQIIEQSIFVFDAIFENFKIYLKKKILIVRFVDGGRSSVGDGAPSTTRNHMGSCCCKSKPQETYCCRDDTDTDSDTGCEELVVVSVRHTPVEMVEREEEKVESEVFTEVEDVEDTEVEEVGDIAVEEDTEVEAFTEVEEQEEVGFPLYRFNFFTAKNCNKKSLYFENSPHSTIYKLYSQLFCFICRIFSEK